VQSKNQQKLHHQFDSGWRLQKKALAKASAFCYTNDSGTAKASCKAKISKNSTTSSILVGASRRKHLQERVLFCYTNDSGTAKASCKAKISKNSTTGSILVGASRRKHLQERVLFCCINDSGTAKASCKAKISKISAAESPQKVTFADAALSTLCGFGEQICVSINDYYVKEAQLQRSQR